MDGGSESFQHFVGNSLESCTCLGLLHNEDTMLQEMMAQVPFIYVSSVIFTPKISYYFIHFISFHLYLKKSNCLTGISPSKPSAPPRHTE